MYFAIGVLVDVPDVWGINTYKPSYMDYEPEGKGSKPIICLADANLSQIGLQLCTMGYKPSKTLWVCTLFESTNDCVNGLISKGKFKVEHRFCMRLPWNIGVSSNYFWDLQTNPWCFSGWATHPKNIPGQERAENRSGSWLMQSSRRLNSLAGYPSLSDCLSAGCYLWIFKTMLSFDLFSKNHPNASPKRPRQNFWAKGYIKCQVATPHLDFWF